MIIFVEYTGQSDRNPNPISSSIHAADLKFLIDKKLIRIKGDIIETRFVGEVITPNNTYFSLPKNFDIKLPSGDPNLVDVRLIRDVLNNYSTIDGIKYGYTSMFDVGDSLSEKHYFNQLKEYFLDYITYEFIYPLKKIKKHSNSPIRGGKINVFDTVKNRNRYGTGITYNVKDVKNTDDWMIDDIYYHTLVELAKDHATTQDLKEISEMKEYLDNEGYIIKPLSELLKDGAIPNTNFDTLLSCVEKSDVGIIHNPIKNILLDYYKPKKFKTEYKVNVFYVEKFQYVWEHLTRDALCHSNEFKESLEELFNKVETKRKWFPSEVEKDKFLVGNKKKIDRGLIKDIVVKRSEEVTGVSDNGVYLSYFSRNLMPDIFSRFPDNDDGRKFIGDAKYYQDPENAHFDKEFFIYNEMMDNIYPMVVFVPSHTTRVVDKRSISDEEGQPEIIIFYISVKQAIKDAIGRKSGSGRSETLRKVHALISKNTNRKNSDSNF